VLGRFPEPSELFLKFCGGYRNHPRSPWRLS
jgi:hypothetical protein